MNYNIRNMRFSEFPYLTHFLYEAIFQDQAKEPLPKSILYDPSIYLYIDTFGLREDDSCLCAELNGSVVGAVWVRIMNGFGHIDSTTPELAISVNKDVRGQGIGKNLMLEMLKYLKQAGYSKTSLAVQKENHTTSFYKTLGFQTIKETPEEFIMIYIFKNEQKSDPHGPLFF